MQKRALDLKKTLTKKFGFSFDSGKLMNIVTKIDHVHKKVETFVENSYKPNDYLRMTTYQKQSDTAG